MSLVRVRKQEQTEKNLQILKESVQTSHREAPVNQQEEGKTQKHFMKRHC